MKFKRPVATPWLVASLLILILGTTLAAWVFFVNARQVTHPVRIGYLPIYVDLPLFVAMERGYFRDADVKVELREFSKSPEIGDALANGNLDVGASIATSVVLANESRDPGRLRVFLVDNEDQKNYLSSIIVPRESILRSVSELRGKTVACFPGPTATVFFKLLLEKHGLNPDSDVVFRELDQSQHLDAISNNEVDAIFTYEPTATQAVMERGARKLLPGAAESIMEPWNAGVWVISSEMARDRPREAQAIASALYRAVDFIRANPAEAKRALSSYTAIKIPIALATPTIPFAKYSEVNKGRLQDHADVFLAKGVISRKVDVNVLLLDPASLSK